jgi:hypothetical protein
MSDKTPGPRPSDSPAEAPGETPTPPGGGTPLPSEKAELLPAGSGVPWPGAPAGIDPVASGPAQGPSHGATATPGAEAAPGDGGGPAAPPTARAAGGGRLDPAMLAILGGMGVLALAVIWLLVHPREEAPGDASLRDRVNALETAQQGLPARLGAVEAAQQGLPPRLAALENGQRGLPDRIAALEAAGQAAQGNGAATATALARLNERLQAQEQAATERGAGAERRFTALEAAAARPVADPQLLANMAGRLDRISERVAVLDARAAEQETRAQAAAALLDRRVAAAEQQVGQRLAAADAAAQQRVAALEASLAGRIQAVEARESRLRETEQRLARLVAAVAAEAALEAGRPLGPALAGLQGQPVPAALSRYADQAPPTESALRLAFDEAARAAQAAVDPGARGQSVLDSAAQRLAGLVTIRRGEQVVWGDAASAELEGARRALEAGDIAAALERIGKLPAPAQAAMAGWVGQARALLEARAAMRGLATGG